MDDRGNEGRKRRGRGKKEREDGKVLEMKGAASEDELMEKDVKERRRTKRWKELGGGKIRMLKGMRTVL